MVIRETLANIHSLLLFLHPPHADVEIQSIHCVRRWEQDHQQVGTPQMCLKILCEQDTHLKSTARFPAPAQGEMVLGTTRRDPPGP